MRLLDQGVLSVLIAPSSIFNQIVGRCTWDLLWKRLQRDSINYAGQIQLVSHTCFFMGPVSIDIIRVPQYQLSVVVAFGWRTRGPTNAFTSTKFNWSFRKIFVCCLNNPGCNWITVGSWSRKNLSQWRGVKCSDQEWRIISNVLIFLGWLRIAYASGIYNWHLKLQSRSRIAILSLLVGLTSVRTFPVIYEKNKE